MIRGIKAENLGVLGNVRWANVGKLNVIAGSPWCGKTYLFRTLYAILHSLESYRLGEGKGSGYDVLLTEKLKGVFLTKVWGEYALGSSGRGTLSIDLQDCSEVVHCDFENGIVSSCVDENTCYPEITSLIIPEGKFIQDYQRSML